MWQVDLRLPLDHGLDRDAPAASAAVPADAMRDEGPRGALGAALLGILVGVSLGGAGGAVALVTLLTLWGWVHG